MTASSRILSSTVDGAALELASWGSGPGLVVVVGGATEIGTYRRLAERLSSSLPVHVYNRRGRGASAGKPAGYGLTTEVGDLSTVLAETGSDLVAGHSVGGYFALAAARTLRIRRLALFDPAVSVDGLFPSDYLDDMERAIGAGDILGAMVIVGRGLRNPGSNLPDPVVRAASRALLLTPPGKTMARLLPTVPPESRLALAGDGPASAWANVTVTTRFFIGANSPDYYLPSAQRLLAVMPDASIELLPRLGHDHLARANRAVVDALVRFLSAKPSS
jgi:pimeloyl-ACP methyl ester carboxylesterase